MQIIKTNLKIYFKNIFPNERNILLNHFAAKIPGYQYSRAFKMGGWDGFHRFYDRKTDSLPIGFFNQLIEVLKKNNFDYEIVDDSIISKPQYNELNVSLDLRDYQIDAINKAIENKRSLVSIATNGGKTIVACGIVQILGLKTLFLTHRQELLKQTHKLFEKELKTKIGIISSDTKNIQDITIGMVPTIHNRIKNNDRDVIEFIKSAEIVIGDEVHRAGAATWQKIFKYCINSDYAIGMSGTIPNIKHFTGMKVASFFGNIIIKVSNDELIEQGFSAKPTVYLLQNNDEDIDRGIRNYKDIYDELVVRSDLRNSLIVNAVKDNFVSGTLVIVNLLEHGRILEKMLIKEGIECVFIHGSAVDRNAAFSDFKAGALSTLISSSILDEGVDIDIIRKLVLGAGGKGGEASRQILQRVGRSLRKKKEGENTVQIWDIIDANNRYLSRHSFHRLSIYEREGFEIRII
ncbi:DEAD/DEAH box helicase family protein [Candidatus Pacearchaeota archaeon]|nr:DEAD/DEAH box helicase family protein [Candidatus Pacearchaeota archaeon]